jgi:hypothetical protein
MAMPLRDDVRPERQGGDVTLLDVVLIAACLVLLVLWAAAIRVAAKTTTDLGVARGAMGEAQNALTKADAAMSALSAADTKLREENAQLLEFDARLREAAASTRKRDEDVAARLDAMSDEELDRFVHVICPYCMGIHDDASGRTCPRVKRMRFGSAGNVMEIEFWSDWPRDGIVWPEDLKGLIGEKRAAAEKPEPKVMVIRG